MVAILSNFDETWHLETFSPQMKEPVRWD